MFIARPTSACASAGASLVPSPVIATRRPPDCSLRISASLSSGVASAMKSSTPASEAIARAVRGLSPVTMTVRMPIARNCANRCAIPGFTTSESRMTPSTRAGSPAVRMPSISGVPPWAAIALTSSVTTGSTCPPLAFTQRVTASAAPLRYSTVPVRSSTSTPLMRVCAVNGTTRYPGWTSARAAASSSPSSCATP